MSDTSVTQGTAFGLNYPFLLPSPDIEGLVLDFYLSYFSGECEPAYPLRISWLYGVGLDSSSSISGAPVPTHAKDLEIRDANDQVIFDSTQATRFSSSAWGSDRFIISWESSLAICRIVCKPQAGFDSNIAPTAGELDSRTYERLPNRVTSLGVGIVSFTGKVQFQNGFNIAFTQEARTRVDGTRLVNRITIDGTPGGGLGKQPGCNPVELLIRKINGIGPDKAGNFIIDTKDCYRIQRPVTIEDSPRLARFGGVFLSDPEEAASAIELHNDCLPCCPCDYYVRTYKGLNRVWDNWLLDARDAESIRDDYSDNRRRWLDSLDCRTTNTARLTTIPEQGCTAQIGGSYCNATKCCAVGLELRFTLQGYEDGEPLSGESVGTRDAIIVGSETKGFSQYALSGSYPVFKAVFPYANPQDVSSVQFRLCLGGCKTNTVVSTTMTVHAMATLPNPDTGEMCEIPGVEVPDSVLEIWSNLGDIPVMPARAIVTRATPIDARPRSYPCGCQGSPTADSASEGFDGQPIDGNNDTFELGDTPVPPASLMVFVNGLLMTEGVDYNLHGSQVVFVPEAVPQAGDLMTAYYRR